MLCLEIQDTIPKLFWVRRELITEPLTFPNKYREAILPFKENNDSRLSIQFELYPDLLLHEKHIETQHWQDFDPRVDWLKKLILKHKQTKVLIIAANVTTAVAIEHTFRVKYGISIALFHEQMTILDRDKSAAWFADPFGATAMVCSEIGSEG